VVDKNLELWEKVKQMEATEDGQADQSMTMAINGVVDAAVNGGTKNYEAFINGEYKVTNPEIAVSAAECCVVGCSVLIDCWMHRRISSRMKGSETWSINSRRRSVAKCKC
jgi:hypothetical protein